MDDAIRLRGRGTAEDWFFTAMARWHLDDKEASRRDYESAVEWMQKHAPTSAELLRFRVETERVLGISK